jgi:peptide subunit release factor 1 (eRF1)
MEKTTTALETPLREHLDRLAAFEPTEFPVLSLYLDHRADNEGRRTQADTFLRKVFPERVRTFDGEARKSVERDVEKIQQYLGDARSSAAAIAIFACSGANDFFEAVQLDVPIDQHWLFVGPVPHLYPLARVNDQYPRYAALLMDTNSAQLFVFGLGSAETQKRITNPKTRRHSMGGWSQARYQRHIENFHLKHTKEVVAELDRIVREERINQVVVACEEQARSVLMSQIPRHLADKIIDMRLNLKTPEHQIMADTLDALRAKDSTTDAEHVQQMIDAWSAGGLAVTGPEATLDALVKGQVEELLITTSPEMLKKVQKVPMGVTPGTVEVDTSAQNATIDPDRAHLADELVTKAQQSAARIRFIEDPELLKNVGGVGALLRFKI